MKKTIQIIAFLFLLLLVAPLPCYAVDYGGIQIDGYYDDWEDKPHTRVYHGNPHDDLKVHLVSLFRDATTVYVHVKMSEKNDSDFHNIHLDLYTNLGTETYSVILDSPPEKKKPEGGTAGLKVYLQNGRDMVGSGYYTRTEGETDDAEFFIPLSTISEQPAGITEISMMIYELGKQKIICVGANTGSYIGIAMCAAIALGSGGYYYNRRKKVQC